jgi:5-aminolevulinate synthase
VTATKSALREPGLPVLAAETHIVPVTVGDPDKCKHASDLLLDRHSNPVDQLSHVPRGTEQ